MEHLPCGYLGTQAPSLLWLSLLFSGINTHAAWLVDLYACVPTVVRTGYLILCTSKGPEKCAWVDET